MTCLLLVEELRMSVGFFRLLPKAKGRGFFVGFART